MIGKVKERQRSVLVTGASGFIGHHLCRRLRESGMYVIGVSRTETQARDVDRWLVADLSRAEDVDRVMAEAKPDIVYHLASYVVGGREVGLVRPMFEANLMSTLNILIAAHTHQCRRVVLTGSLEEPQPDTCWAVPSSPYAAAKFAASAYGRMFYALYELPVVMLRLFMVYGPEQRDLNKLIPYTILALKRGEPPKVSSGERLVDWVYVDDVVDAFIACADADAAVGQTIDIGSGELVSVRDVVVTIAKMMAPEIEIAFGAVAERKHEQIRIADLGNAKQLLGWGPKTSLTEGLAATIASLSPSD